MSNPNEDQLKDNSDKEHSKPPEGLLCLICYCDIDDESYVEYQTEENSEWFPAQFCIECIEELLSSQFQRYVENFEKSDCRRQQRALLVTGPPINICDKHGFPESDTKEVHQLWYSVNHQVHSAKLEGSLVGKERQELWNQLQSIFDSQEPDTN